MSQPSNGAYGDDDKIVVDPTTGGINFANLQAKMQNRYSKARQAQQQKIYKNEILGLADPDCLQGYKDLVKVAYEVIKGKDPQEQLETLDKFIKFAIGQLGGSSHFPAVAKAMAGGAIWGYVKFYATKDKDKQVIPQYVLDCASAVGAGLNVKKEDPQAGARLMLHAILKGMNDFAPEALDPKDRVKIEKESDKGVLKPHDSKVESVSSSVTGSGSRDSSIEAGLQDMVHSRPERAESTDSMQSAWDDHRHAEYELNVKEQESKQAVKEQENPKQAEKLTPPQEESKPQNNKKRFSWSPFNKRG